MNRKTAQILTLAALSTFSAASMAFNTRVMPKAETKIELPTAAPKVGVELKTPVTTDIKVGNTLNVKSDIVVGAKKADLKGKGCDAAMFDRAAAGTSVDSKTLQMLQAHNAINVDNLGCDPNPEAYTEYETEPREIGNETALCTFNHGIEHVAGLDARGAIGGPCLMDVKRAHGQKDVTLESATKDFKKIATKCNIFPKDAVSAQ